MRIAGFWGAFIALGLWVIASAALGQNQAREYFDRVDITVEVDKSGNLKIREELDYVKPRGARKRGIFKELPLRVKDGAVTYEKAYRLTLATRNGQAEPVTRQGGNGTLVWRLGRADVFLNEGVQRYVLEYETKDWLVRYDDLDELR
jgi:hypothetical protein